MFFYSPWWPKRLQLGALSCLTLMLFISRWFLQFQHVDPAEAVCIHEDLQSRHSLGIHWGTFPTGKEVCYSCTNGHVTCIFLLGIFSWGCPAWFSKPWPYFRPKNVICHTHFQTWPVKSVPVFRPGGGKIYTRFQTKMAQKQIPIWLT